jgi:alanyl-tRNA synthetase
MTDEEMVAVERLVNQQIRANHKAVLKEMTPDEAKEAGAMALFGERYGKVVRVLAFGDFSVEICGGTHARSTGDIGLFKIVSESACASGVRRIEAVTGATAFEHVIKQEHMLKQVANEVKSSINNIVPRIAAMVEESRVLQKELAAIKQKMVGHESDYLLAKAVSVNGISVLTVTVAIQDSDGVRDLLDRLKQKLKNAAILLATVVDGKVKLVAGVAKTVLPFFTASDLLNHVALQIDGRGGGRPDLAQGGGDNPAALPSAMASVPLWVASKVEADRLK